MGDWKCLMQGIKPHNLEKRLKDQHNWKEKWVKFFKIKNYDKNTKISILGN